MDLTRAADRLNSMLHHLRGLVACKTLRDVSAEYERSLTRLANATMAGRMKASAMASQHRELIKRLGRQAYVEGLAAGLVDEEEMEPEDEQAIEAWTAEQLSRVADFAKAASEAETDPERGGIENRVGLWVRSLEACGNLGRASAQRNQMVVWKLSINREEHCSTCMELHNTRHRIRWYLDRGYIPRQPGSKTLECGGWNCGCGLYEDRSGGKRVL